MTQPVPNVLAPIVDRNGKLLPPWNSFFQQFVQKSPAIQNISQNPFTANQNGTVIVDASATTTSITRGSTTINLGAGQKIIPVSISDTITTDGAISFLGS